MEIKDKKILIVGSSYDMNGKRLGKDIDGGKWDIVIRLNKNYGSPLDNGTKTDLYFTRWLSWLGTITPKNESAEYVYINDGQGINPKEVQIICEEIGVNWASCGAVAVGYCLHRGAKSISLLGFGYNNDIMGFCPKAYCKAYAEKQPLSIGRYQQDLNTHYDWGKETFFYINNGVIFL